MMPAPIAVVEADKPHTEWSRTDHDAKRNKLQAKIKESVARRAKLSDAASATSCSNVGGKCDRCELKFGAFKEGLKLDDLEKELASMDAECAQHEARKVQISARVPELQILIAVHRFMATRVTAPSAPSAADTMLASLAPAVASPQCEAAAARYERELAELVREGRALGLGAEEARTLAAKDTCAFAVPN